MFILPKGWGGGWWWYNDKKTRYVIYKGIYIHHEPDIYATYMIENVWPL